MRAPCTSDDTASLQLAPRRRARPPDAGSLEAVRSIARASRLLERAAGDLGMAQYRVLSAIAAGDERASRVAARFGLGRPTVSAAVDALCRQSLLDRRESSGDHRVTDLALTAKGKVLLAQVEVAMVAVLDDLCTCVPTAASVIDALASLGPALDMLQTNRRERVRMARV